MPAMLPKRTLPPLLALPLLACGPGNAASGGEGQAEAEASETLDSSTGETETETETGEAACPGWSGSFALRAREPISVDGRGAAASALSPGLPVGLYLATKPGTFDDATNYRVQVAADGGLETLYSYTFNALVATTMFAFEEVLVTADIGVAIPTDFTVYGSYASVWPILDGVVELGTSFPEGVLDELGEVTVAATRTSPGIVDAYYSRPIVSAQHLRIEDGQASELGEVPLGVSSALSFADLDGDGFQDLISATDKLVQIHWADAEGPNIGADSTSLDRSGGLALAAGNIDEDPALELVVAIQNSPQQPTGRLYVFDNASGRDLSELGFESTGVMFGLEVDTQEFGYSNTRPSFELVDLDGDGFDDLLYTEAEYISGQFGGALGGSLEVGEHRVMVQRACGDGSFALAEAVYTHDDRIAQVHAVDFSEDGALDLLVVESRDTVLVSLEQE